MKSIILSAIKHGKPLATPKKGSKGRLGKLRRELKRLQKKLRSMPEDAPILTLPPKAEAWVGGGLPSGYTLLLPSQASEKPIAPTCPECGRGTRIVGQRCGRCFLKSLEVETCETHGLPISSDGSCIRCVEEKRIKDEGLDPALQGVKRVIDL